MFAVNTQTDLLQIDKLLMENSVFHVMVMMMYLALLCNELAAIDL